MLVKANESDALSPSYWHCTLVSRTRMYFLFYYYNAIVSNAEYISPPKMQLNFSSLFFSNHKKMVTVGSWKLICCSCTL